jgi:hypothetical protein
MFGRRRDFEIAGFPICRRRNAAALLRTETSSCRPIRALLCRCVNDNARKSFGVRNKHDLSRPFFSELHGAFNKDWLGAMDERQKIPDR